jgi:PEGA domain
LTRLSLAPHSKFAILAALAIATMWPADALAQRAVRRSAGRSVVAVSARPYYYYPRSYYWPYYYGGFYGSYYSPFFWGQYPYPYPYYGGWAYDNTGSARLQVTPRHTQVYVDGYFVGVVDDFDGNLQRLNVEAGEHELQLYLDGHRTFTQKVLLTRGRTLKIVHTMEPLGPGETAQPIPKREPEAGPQPYTRAEPRQGPPPRGGRASEYGSLLLRVRPADAEVVIDGEVWRAPENEDQIVLELTEGPHRIEVRKAGFQTYTTTVRVRRGETVRLNVSLTTGGALTGEF